MYFPPVNFGYVEEGLYRCAHPCEINFPFLERLKLKTLIYLFPDVESDVQLESFLEDEGIQLICLGEEGEGSGATKFRQLMHSVMQHVTHDLAMYCSHQAHMIAEETVLKAMSYIVNTSYYPILVTCSTGKHRTGTVMACLRKLQHWSLTSIFEEYRRFTKHKARVQNEQFIELFDTDLVTIPVNSPRYL
ncbi:unnamed protein product [Chrysoparadoxa australica]